MNNTNYNNLSREAIQSQIDRLKDCANIPLNEKVFLVPPRVYVKLRGLGIRTYDQLYSAIMENGGIVSPEQIGCAEK